MRLTYLGHATVLMESGGTVLLTDPLLRGTAGHLRRYAPLPRVASLPAIDAVLISHVHHDHLDFGSLRALPAGRTVIGPPGLARLLRGTGAHVIELAEGEEAKVGRMVVRATHADHHVRRLPWQRPIPALGFVIDGGPHVYFAGDTDRFEAMATIDRGLDAALLPVAGWGPRVGAGHMDPERAARALTLLRPRLAIPIHWGTYAPPRARPADPQAPARAFQRLAAELDPAVKVMVLQPGEATTVQRN